MKPPLRSSFCETYYTRCVHKTLCDQFIDGLASSAKGAQAAAIAIVSFLRIVEDVSSALIAAFASFQSIVGIQ